MNEKVTAWIAATSGGAAWLGTAVGAGAFATAVCATLGALTAATIALRRHRAHAKALQRSLQRRDEQLAHTAHELRTPLTSVLTALEMLRLGYATTEAERSEFLDEADLAARHLAYLVNDVLDGASMAAGRLRLDVGEHRVAELVTDGLRVLGLQAERRGVPVTTATSDPELAVRADPRRFLQVLFNLVGNAVKFSAPGEPVHIDVQAAGDAVRIEIVDRGPGVPRELLPHLFEPFERGQAGGQPSTGLGLHITKRLVEQMQGRIGHSEPPAGRRGATFWFELPRVTARERTIAPDTLAAR